ncbi:Mitochondrial distribution and morphology protein 31 [Erysiphe neolycopersici]|uniref:Mitochondrial distribution and morphology protein 31 n=1 Tax=Erysiphe neolycopersici TaxID=212602 RepID=A0A420HXM9_9PEZI|nr:Mitochondrial distribution and morphology protein 31 [Erysiphe neolycopersici]
MSRQIASRMWPRSIYTRNPIYYPLKWPSIHTFRRALFQKSNHFQGTKPNSLSHFTCSEIFLYHARQNGSAWNSRLTSRNSWLDSRQESSRSTTSLCRNSTCFKYNRKNVRNFYPCSCRLGIQEENERKIKADSTILRNMAIDEDNSKNCQNVRFKNELNSYFRSQIPKMPHRPTKEELLSAATGFWSRLKVRFKWFSIRSVRPWNVDDWSAFVSWFVVGNIVWVLVGTTTFFSLVIFSINTVVAQDVETLARWIGDYLTHSSGVKVVFESAVVPKWKDGVITFDNVFVSRRPGQGKAKVRKGSSANAAAEAAAERQNDLDSRREEESRTEEEEDTNYTQFDLTIATINVTLSFVKWWNGRGLLRDVEVKGVRGIVDRTSVTWPSERVDPRTYLREHHPGDFEIDSFKLDDLLVTIHQPNGFRPFPVRIFYCDLPKLRKQWLFYDILSADHMSGAYDESLFTIHPHQIYGVARFKEDEMWDINKSLWKKHSRLRIDGLNIDHLNRGVTGPFGWIYEGNVDIVADILFPADTDESISKVMSDFYDRMEATVNAHRYQILANENTPEVGEVSTHTGSKKYTQKHKGDENIRFLIMELKLHLNEVKAAVPLFTRDLSYVNQTLIRPIVAYINNRRTFIPISCRIVKHVSDFNGSWTIFDSGLMDNLSAETYEAFSKDVVDRQARMRRLKKVGLWSISLAVQALFMGLAGNAA